MAGNEIKRALISVYDKTGIVDFARALVDEFGIEIISTGGTAALLKENGMPVTLVEEITGFSEMLDGRVKTLHPKIHAAILADRDNPQHMRQLKEQGIEPIDMVVVNLYPFEKTTSDPECTFAQAVEMIDIGGPCLLRAAAKNHKHVLVVESSDRYRNALHFLRGERMPVFGQDRALAVFRRTTDYDSKITSWLSSSWPRHWRSRLEFLELWELTALRYGENPHQPARVLLNPVDPKELPRGLNNDPRGSAKPMSFNNYLDSSAANDLCSELVQSGNSRNSCVFVKHGNPCGVGVSKDMLEAYRKAYLGDPNAAMGGILAVSFGIDTGFARAVLQSLQTWGKDAGAGAFFVEVIIAAGFEDAAVEVIRTGKRWGADVRLLAVPNRHTDPPPHASELDYKGVRGGLLVQSVDSVGLNEDQWKVATKREPTDAEMTDLRLAWLVCKHTKSNAISICKDGMLIGNGAGQMSRVMSCRIATWLAREDGHAGQLPGSVAASDGFFPFSDGPNILMDAGVTAIIQPGGSKRDSDTIAACDERNVAMIFTGTRHFKH